MKEHFCALNENRWEKPSADEIRELFISIAENHRDSLINVAYGFLHEKEAALDVVQEALLKAYRKLSTFQNQSSLFTWVYRITANLCKDRLRQRKRQKTAPVEEMGGDNHIFELPDLAANPRRSAELKERDKIVMAAIELLPDNHQQILILREAGGLSYKEIARVLKCREGTVMSRLFHARKMLAARLKTFAEDLGS
ncbi:MAG: sigma-70 family RNA polymerase sigma factor [Candidatus Omnitrophota bacterium]|jgi:RNA polymerase sigma-70 factor (ECF subfamily)|nr:MAG: sigma-70 family RNA polymerase sigma factor [Candidatus Omnitrophota bacterium]